MGYSLLLVASCCILAFAVPNDAFGLFLAPFRGFATYTAAGRQSILDISKTMGEVASSNDNEDKTQQIASMKRSDFFATLLVASAAIMPQLSSASIDLLPYHDATCGFQIMVPSSWEQSTQQLPDRRKIVLFAEKGGENVPDKEKTLLFIAYTPIRDDYTSLSALGTVDQVGQMTILPKGGILSSSPAEAQPESKLLAAVSKKNAYYFDYTVQIPGESMMHHRSIFYLAQGATGGAGSVLVTMNFQAPESKYGTLNPTIDLMFDSFGKL